MPSRHDWNGWEGYLAAHEGHLRSLEHFIELDALQWIPSQTQVDWKGILYCLGSIEIRVHKLQDVEIRGGSHLVRTTDYSYHVQRRNKDESVTNLFRYDNVHPHPGHATAHHKHTFRPNGDDVISHVGEDWPTLGEVIQEAEELYNSGALDRY
jgi:hypothetical protein